MGQASDAQYLERLNIVQDNIFSKLWTVDKKYAWTYYVSDLVKDQEEYTLPMEFVDQLKRYPWLKRLLKVYVDYGNWYKRAKIYSDTAIENYSKEEPIASNIDGSIFLYPTPTEDKEGWIRLEWTYIPYPVKIDDESEDLKLPREYHDLYVLWLNKLAFTSKQLYDKEWIMEQKYQFRLEQLLREWVRDIDSAYMEQTPDLSYFE